MTIARRVAPSAVAASARPHKRSCTQCTLSAGGSAEKSCWPAKTGPRMFRECGSSRRLHRPRL